MNLREKQLLRIMAQEAIKDPDYIKLLLNSDLGSKTENPIFTEFEIFVDCLIKKQKENNEIKFQDEDFNIIKNKDLKTIIMSVFE